MKIKEIIAIASDEDIVRDIIKMQNIQSSIEAHSYSIYEEKTAKRELRDMAKRIIANIQ